MAGRKYECSSTKGILTKSRISKIRGMTNIEVTNRGWMRYLHTIDRLANAVAFPEKGKRKESLDRLRKFLINTSLLMEPDRPNEITDEHWASIEQQYEMEVSQ